MKNTSCNAIRNIEHVLLKCKSVNEHQLIGFNPERASNQQRNPEKAELYSITLQIKILAQLPELIWRHLDNDEFFIATQLFILARHIHTGLRLNKTSGANGELVVTRFPLVKNQWALLQQFFGIIKDRCNSRLETEDLLPEVASKCLASLILLESTGVEALLQNLLNSRLKAFCDVLNDDSGKFSVVRDKLLASLTVLNNTVLLIHKCFIDDQQGSRKGLLAVELNRLSSDTAPYTISHVISMANSKAVQFLPDIIAKYRPSVPITEVPLHSVHNMMRQWLSALTKIAGTNVKTLVNLIGSVKVIREIKEISMERDRTSNSRWTEICGDLEMPRNMNFYRQFFHTLINDRVKEIIQTSWSETQRRLTEDIDAWLEETAKTPQNMARFVWTEEQMDIPLSLGQALDQDLKKRKLLMKSRGFVTEVLRICQQLDGNLEALYKEVDNYLAKDGHAQLTPTDELRGDQEDLVKFLIAASRTAIQDLVTGLRVEKKIQDKESLLQMARLFQAIRDLCPHLRLILCFRMDSGGGVMAMQGEENWMLVARQLEEESIAYWIRFADQYFAEWCVSDALSRPMGDFSTVLEEFAAWQSVMIEEKDEQGNAVQSTIRIPSQPSVRLQTTLFRVVAELNKIAPQTIPAQVIGHLMERVTGELLNHYEKLNEGEFVRDNQHVSLQFYFDIRYVTLLLIPRDVQNKSLPDQAQRVQNLFKSQVDPFDFELFFGQLTKNVKTAAIRSHNQLGVIIPNMEHLMTVLGGDTSTTTTTDKAPNVLALSSTTVTWFPLLPIAAPIVKEVTDVGGHGDKKMEVEVS